MQGLDLEWCKSSDRGLPSPDAVFFMDIEIDEASTRGDFGDERYEVTSFQKTVREKFKQLQDQTWTVSMNSNMTNLSAVIKSQFRVYFTGDS